MRQSFFHNQTMRCYARRALAALLLFTLLHSTIHPFTHLVDVVVARDAAPVVESHQSETGNPLFASVAHACSGCEVAQHYRSASIARVPAPELTPVILSVGDVSVYCLTPALAQQPSRAPPQA